MYTNCQFKIKAGYEDWILMQDWVKGRSIRMKVQSIIETYFKEVSHNAVIPHEELLGEQIIPLQRECLNPYQVEFLHGAMKDNDKLVIGYAYNENLEKLSEKKELSFLKKENFHVNSYNFLVGDDRRTMISLNGLFMTAAFNQTIYFCGNPETVKAIKELEM